MKAFIRGFGYAFEGLWYALSHERNMRVHMGFLGYMLFFLLRYDFFKVSKGEMAVLIAISALVISLEYVNTAIERAVDQATGGKITKTAKTAKDTAAAAVLFAALGAVVCGLIILLQPQAFRDMAAYFLEHPARLAAMLASIAAVVTMIFAIPTKKDSIGDGND